MATSIMSLIIGLVLLVLGGEALLRGAVGAARVLKLSPALVGLTIVAAATSVPELAVSLLAAINGTSDIAVGNVVGSNIANITLILGVSASICALSITGNAIRYEYPVLILASYLAVVLAADGQIGALDGSLMLLFYGMFSTYMVALVRHQMSAGEEQGYEEAGLTGDAMPVSRLMLFLIVGIALLWGGAQLTVVGAIEIARLFGISDRVIGLTVVAVGTSLPEIVASVISSLRGRHDIAIGNLIGSNIFNLLVILGLTGTIHPIAVSAEIRSYDNWWMLATAIFLFPLMRTGFRVSRLEGVLLIVIYAGYLATLL